MKLSALAFAALLLAAGEARALQPPAYILIDADQGMVLADRYADVLWYPASLSKLMTAYVAFAALKAGRVKLTSPVVVSQNALDQPPSKMGFQVGTVMTLDNALKMLLVKSANDIAVAIAESVGGRESAFVGMMNDAASRLGMASTRWDNPHGLPDPGQVTTARDLAVLATAIWTDFPEYRSYLGIPAIKSGKKVLTSENRLLERYRGTNGMKTGFTCSAGYNLVASATRDGHTMIAVVLGEDSWSDVSERAAGLLNNGFNPPIVARIGSKADLSTFATTPAMGAAVDMRDFGVCKPGKDDVEGVGEGSQSSLEPKFTLMPPVVVTTGGADPRSGTATTRVATAAPAAAPAAATSKAKVVPVPRLRPAPSAAAATSGPPTVFSLED